MHSCLPPPPVVREPTRRQRHGDRDTANCTPNRRHSMPESRPNASTPIDAQRIVDTLHEPLLVLDDALVVQQVNPAFHRAFSVPNEEAIGEVLYELGGGYFDRPALRESLARLREEREPFRDLELHLGDAHQQAGREGRRVLRVNGQMLSGDAEATERILLAVNDRTEQRRTEAKLRRHARKLEESNEDLEQFAYAASHDLQEPLRMVSSYLQLLERRYKEALDESAREFIEYAVDGAERMKTLIDGLLQYSRVGRKEGTFGRVDLGTIVDDVRADLARRIEELGGTVERTALPTTHGTAEQLRRLFQNLVDNALTYHGDAPPRVEISGRTTDADAAHVVVRDHGPGIPARAQDKVFRIFKQLDPHGTGHAGSGIGLALCKKIAERHGGRIWVESEPGEGAAFHVLLNLEAEGQP